MTQACAEMTWGEVLAAVPTLGIMPLLLLASTGGEEREPCPVAMHLACACGARAHRRMERPLPDRVPHSVLLVFILPMRGERITVGAAQGPASSTDQITIASLVTMMSRVTSGSSPWRLRRPKRPSSQTR
jgi:hypothetical protein